MEDGTTERFHSLTLVATPRFSFVVATNAGEWFRSYERERVDVFRFCILHSLAQLPTTHWSQPGNPSPLLFFCHMQ